MFFLLLTQSVFAIRPDQGGMYSFSSNDQLAYVDSLDGQIRVHYSYEGDNVTLLDDDDENGSPDFVEMVAETTADVLNFYEQTGFNRPLSEEDLGLSQLGGSFAFDVYLVDFAGVGDGMFSTDSCNSEPNVCSGFFIMENDFSGYGYPSLEMAVQTLTSHELFHAVQHSYESDSPIWYTEGTAVWAERLYDPDNEDYLWFAEEYLADVGRSLDEPPTGPVPGFAYGTCLWWGFLSERLGDQIIVDLAASLEWDGQNKDTLIEMNSLIEQYGSTLNEEWSTFASWNLATGGRSGLAESYSYADKIGPVDIEVEAKTIYDDNRFYPLAATYFQIHHPGGDLYFVNIDDATGLNFTMHQVANGAEDGPILDPFISFNPSTPGWFNIGNLEEGSYFLVGSYPKIADNSQKVQFCLGDKATCEQYLPFEEQDTGEIEEQGGCGCNSGALGGIWVLPLFLGVFRRKR